jgi:hypothetical protein
VEDLEGKLNALFSSPESMERIMQLARTLSGNENAGNSAPSQVDTPSGSGGSDNLGGIDPQMMQVVAGAMKAFSAPSEAEKLISAIKPYLSSSRIEKIERAVSIARLAKVAKKVLPELGGKGHV